jgi:hypothetical protein
VLKIGRHRVRTLRKAAAACQRGRRSKVRWSRPREG